jgi:hypothetical protein
MKQDTTPHNRLARKQVTKTDLLREIDESVLLLRGVVHRCPDVALQGVIKRLAAIHHQATVHQ